VILVTAANTNDLNHWRDVLVLVVDVAQSIDGRWIVIECNDGQESGYAGVSPIGLWQNIIALEKARE